MKVTLLQTAIEWNVPIRNRHRAQQLIERLPPTDLIVLPEMFTTGFCTSPQEIAEEANSDTLLWMQQMAHKQQAAVAGSVLVKETGRFYNRVYFVKPDGSYTTYNKRHLFSFGGEDIQFTAGRERVIVTHAGCRILLQICYDLRFPVFSRNVGDYDLLIYVANWPIQRIEAWNILLKARAIENQCYVAGVNRVGEDLTCRYNGNSSLIDYLGNPLITATQAIEESIAGAVDLAKLADFRAKFPALKDADHFIITP